MNAVVTIAPYAATQKNGQIVCNLFFDELLRSVKGVYSAICEGQEDRVRHPDFVWPDDKENAWYCDSTIQMVIRDLESIQSRPIAVDDLGSHFFQIESALKLIKFAAPKSAAYVGRCLDSAIKLAGTGGNLILDCIEKEKPVTPQIEPEIKRSRKATAKTQEVAA